MAPLRSLTAPAADAPFLRLSWAGAGVDVPAGVERTGDERRPREAVSGGGAVAVEPEAVAALVELAPSLEAGDAESDVRSSGEEGSLALPSGARAVCGLRYGTAISLLLLSRKLARLARSVGGEKTVS